MEIRLASVNDLPVLSEIEVEAGRLFADHGMEEIAGDEGAPLSVLMEHQAAGHVWVAVVDDKIVGYLTALLVDDCLHVEQVSVRPSHGRQGIGGALLSAAAQCALDEGRPALTLTTFVEVPWNAPYYQRQGFRLLSEDELTPGLRAIRAREATMKLDKWPRTAMRRDLP
ncbi:MAG: GNAT family N-acetyltransferase [Hamadaea sp.]|uniref:GNAT family N-acetyltransferase n=1 Tax=Hamadaea sp. TaxID=2024425 RepID=UPI0017DF4E36|nr:GNAT family N-acetyltransferase [Hamadaea sp.]NUT23555.1 GNAT family N-acetyltransferase [Hamadaea sp.]